MCVCIFLKRKFEIAMKIEDKDKKTSKRRYGDIMSAISH